MKTATKTLMLAIIMAASAYGSPAAQAEYTLSESKVFGDTALGTKNLSLTEGKTSSLSLPGDAPGSWFIADNTNPRTVRASLKGSQAEFEGLSEGVSSARICSFLTAKCLNASMTVAKNPEPSGNVLGATAFKNGMLISQGQTIYLVYKNTKAPFTDMSAFTGYGFSPAMVMPADPGPLASVGYEIGSSKAPHPWGTWIKSGKAVYFIHELGLIPVPNYDTFLKNGGSDSLLVSANKHDFELSVLAPMENNDARLR